MRLLPHNNSDSLCRWMFEYAEFGIIITDHELNIIDVNRWLELKTLKESILLNGKSIFEVFPEIQQRRMDHYLTQALDGASVILSARFHNHLLRMPSVVHGESVDMRQTVRISPFFKGNNIAGVIIYIEDVTERMVREEEMQRKNEELQRLISTKDKFFRIVAHDLRSPIIAILSLSEILTSDESMPAEKTKELLQVIHSSVKNQYNFLENLLKWSQLQSGRFEMEFQVINLAELVNHILKIVEPTIKSKEIQVSRQVPEDLVLSTDRQALTSILYNIIFNALKFCFNKGRIRIGALQYSDHIEISIEDNGIGISQERILKLFRIDESISTKGTNQEKGSGLGLILVKEFIDKLGGSIRVESTEGEGTTFHVMLPVEEK